jgi:hypothetical protein
LKESSKQQDEKPAEGDKDRDEDGEEDDIEMKDPSMFIENQDMTKGAKLTMTFNDGLAI